MKQHRQICKLLNVGHGDMQVRTDTHTSRSNILKEAVERVEHILPEDTKRFFKLFEDSTEDGSPAAALEMKAFANLQTKQSQKSLLCHSLFFLVRSDTKMLSWPNSPLLVLLQFVDPDVLLGDQDKPLKEGATRQSPLHFLADLADPSDYSTHENQLILAKQLIEHGANVNAVSSPHGRTPLHMACDAESVTNLDFVEYLLEVGADPNVQDHRGATSLMCTIKSAPGAAKFLLNWPSTDVNIIARSGASFLTIVRYVVVKYFSDQVALPDNPEQVQDQLLLQQWIKIEEMLVERGAADTGITTLE
jgi:hypothetical protein